MCTLNFSLGCLDSIVSRAIHTLVCVLLLISLAIPIDKMFCISCNEELHATSEDTLKDVCLQVEV